MAEKTWTTSELVRELARFEQQLVAAGLKPTSVHTYVDRADRFIRWLDGTYTPRA